MLLARFWGLAMRNPVVSVARRLRTEPHFAAIAGGILGFLAGVGCTLVVFARHFPADHIFTLMLLVDPPAEVVRALVWTLVASTCAGIVGCVLGAILAANLVKETRWRFAIWDMLAVLLFLAVVLIAITLERDACREVRKCRDSQMLRGADNPSLMGFFASAVDNDAFIAISRDGSLLATGTTPKHNDLFEKDVRLWELPSLRERPINVGAMSGMLTAFCVPVAFSPDGKTLAVGTEGRGVILWDVNRNRERATIPLGESTVLRVEFSPDGQTLATARRWFNKSQKRLTTELNVWNLRTGEDRMLDLPPGFPLSAYRNFPVIAFSPDGKALICGALWLWDAATGRRGATLQADGQDMGLVRSLAFSPDGKILAAGHAFGVKLWDLDSGFECASIGERLVGRMSCLAFSPDGKILATANAGAIEEFWNSVGGRGIKLWDVCRTADSKARARSTLKLKMRCRLQENAEDFVNRMAFSADGKTLTTVAAGERRIWDAASGEELTTQDATGRLRKVQLVIAAILGIAFCWCYRSSSRRRHKAVVGESG